MDSVLIPIGNINEVLSYDLLEGWPGVPGEPLTVEQYNFIFDNAKEFEEKQRRLGFTPQEGSCINFLKKYPRKREVIN